MASFSVLDTKPSHVLDFPLTVKQQIWFLFFLPTFWLTVSYIADISTDIAVGLTLINEGHIFPGMLTILILYISPIIIYFKRLTTPPETKEVNVALIWLFVETAATVLFPVRPLQCFAERLFWSIEAIRLKDPNREEALIEFENTRVFIIENYLFIQAFVQAGPQVFLQTYLLATGITKDQSTEIVQLICIFTSLATLALTVSSYQRYESQVCGGRNQIWTTNDRSLTNLLYNSELNANSQQRSCNVIKVMEEDNPLGSILIFLFWFFFLLGRILSLVLASISIPWVVLGVCIAHYIVFLAYILSTAKCRTAIKIILPFVYIFCLIEVGLQFRKCTLLYNLFFFLTIIENILLTVLWVSLVNWNGLSFYYGLYVIGISHCLATLFIITYLRFCHPKTCKIVAN